MSGPTIPDKLEVMAHKMTDAQLRSTIEAIVGSPKHAGYRARRLGMAETWCRYISGPVSNTPHDQAVADEIEEA